MRQADVDFVVRTDLAIEERERVWESGSEIAGVRMREWEAADAGIRVTEVLVCDERGEEALGKPVGVYLTLDAPSLAKKDEDYHREVSEELSGLLRGMFVDHGLEAERMERPVRMLVVGLGNRQVTADALGPRVADRLFINRHIILEFGAAAYNRKKMNRVSCLVPGVMAQTGMESAEIVRGVVKETKPDLVLVVDALAARSTKRLNRTFQISDAGIYPGSGVGNHRNALTGESLGVPVLAIGVPTVVDAATIVGDALREMEQENDSALLQNREHPQALSGLNNMYVTGKDIDETILYLSEIVSDGINRALNPEG